MHSPPHLRAKADNLPNSGQAASWFLKHDISWWSNGITLLTSIPLLTTPMPFSKQNGLDLWCSLGQRSLPVAIHRPGRLSSVVDSSRITQQQLAIRLLQPTIL